MGPVDQKYDKSVYFAPNGEKFSWIGQYDANSLYPCVMQQNMPTGMGLYLEPDKKGTFRAKLMSKNPFANASKKSYIFMDYIQQSDKFIDKNGNKVLLQTGITHGEKKIGNFYLDGYAEVDGFKIGVDFHGCRFHYCPFNCETKKNPNIISLEDQNNREKYLEGYLDEYIKMFECEFDILEYKMSGNIYKFLFQDKISEQNILEAVENGCFYGFLNVSIETPQNIFEKYKDLGLPFIFQNMDLTEGHLSETMKSLAFTNGIKFPRRQLVITYNADGVLINTDLLRYYLKCGLKVTRIYYGMEYIPGKPFEEFVQTLTKMRIEASRKNADPEKQEENENKQILAKMILNSSYGKLGLNIEKQDNVMFCRKETLRSNKNTMYYKRHRQLQAEFEIDLFEVIKSKKSAVDSIPVHCALTILQLSKLHMLKFAHFIFEHLHSGSFSLLYSDTDSLNMAFTDNLDDLVKPEKITSWKKLKYTWFVKDESPEETRSPGKFKIEYLTKTGIYCGLSSKCYILEDNEHTKISTKGVPQSLELNKNVFLEGLYNGQEKIYRDITNFRYSNKFDAMTTIQTRKKIINSCYLKFHVQPNLNDLLPLRFENKIC